MKEEIKVLELDKYEMNLLINALNEFRNKTISEKGEIDHIDDLLLKLIDAPSKKRGLHKVFEDR